MLDSGAERDNNHPDFSSRGFAISAVPVLVPSVRSTHCCASTLVDCSSGGCVGALAVQQGQCDAMCAKIAKLADELESLRGCSPAFVESSLSKRMPSVVTTQELESLRTACADTASVTGNMVKQSAEKTHDMLCRQMADLRENLTQGIFSKMEKLLTDYDGMINQRLNALEKDASATKGCVPDYGSATASLGDNTPPEDLPAPSSAVLSVHESAVTGERVDEGIVGAGHISDSDTSVAVSSVAPVAADANRRVVLETPTKAAACDETHEELFFVGDHVRFCRLKTSALNNAIGTLVPFDSHVMRFGVALLSGEHKRYKQKRHDGPYIPHLCQSAQDHFSNFGRETSYQILTEDEKPLIFLDNLPGNLVFNQVKFIFTILLKNDPRIIPMKF